MMTKAEILKQTGLSEEEFYKKFPTQESFQEFYKGGKLPKYANGAALKQLKGGLETLGGGSAGAGAAGVASGLAAPMIDKLTQNGNEATQLFGSAASGAARGAASGAMFGPIGIGVGAVVGGASGYVQGQQEMRAGALQDKNQAFTANLNEQAANIAKAQTGTDTSGYGVGQMKYGGMFKYGMGGPMYEAEGGEVLQSNNLSSLYGGGNLEKNSSDAVKLEGPSHEQGGMPMSTNGEGRIFSDRLKPKGDKKNTFADLADDLTKELGKLEDSEKKSAGQAAKNTSKYMKKDINFKLDALFDLQESQKSEKEEKKAMKAFKEGGYLEYSKGLGEYNTSRNKYSLKPYELHNIEKDALREKQRQAGRPEPGTVGDSDYIPYESPYSKAVSQEDLASYIMEEDIRKRKGLDKTNQFGMDPQGNIPFTGNPMTDFNNRTFSSPYNKEELQQFIDDNAKEYPGRATIEYIPEDDDYKNGGLLKYIDGGNIDYSKYSPAEKAAIQKLIVGGKSEEEAIYMFENNYPQTGQMDLGLDPNIGSTISSGYDAYAAAEAGKSPAFSTDPIGVDDLKERSLFPDNVDIMGQTQNSMPAISGNNNLQKLQTLEELKAIEEQKERDKLSANPYSQEARAREQQGNDFMETYDQRIAREDAGDAIEDSLLKMESSEKEMAKERLAASERNKSQEQMIEDLKSANSFSTASSIPAVAYNLYQGMFGEVSNPYFGRASAMPGGSQALRDAGEYTAYNPAAELSANQAGAGRARSQMGRTGNLAAMMQGNLAAGRMEGQGASQILGGAERMNVQAANRAQDRQLGMRQQLMQDAKQTELFNLQQDMREQDYYDKALGARQGMLTKGLEQVGIMGQQQAANKLQMARLLKYT